ncbi:MAG: fasciclin domain-containing protein [Verrucomicrobia bacterium]|nr:fasciclin domain-containing protein [Verrucomicrobiota bacterium]
MNKGTLSLLCAALAAFSVAFCLDNTAATEEPATEVRAAYPLLAKPELSTLVMLVQKAGLGDFFKGTGPFTVFAPSNSAFEKMDPAAFEALQKPENRGTLIDLINYHVVMGAYPSNELKSRSYRTVNGKDIEVKNENGKITVNGANVVQTDIKGPNGVGYIIDTVLTPPQT